MESFQTNKQLNLTQTLKLNENDNNNNTTEINTECLRGETSVEPNTDPIVNTQQISIQIPESSCSEVFNRQTQNQSVEMQQEFSEAFHYNKLKLKRRS